MTVMPDSPFDIDSVNEIVLDRTPIVRALAQVRFPQLAAMLPPNFDSTATAVMSELSAQYGIVQQRVEAVIVISPDGMRPSQEPNNKVYAARDTADEWTVSLGPNFIALDTKRYTVRADFLARLETVLGVLERVVRPPIVERVGVRYTNRISDENLLLSLTDLLRPECVGGLDVPRPEGVALVHMMNESLFTVAPSTMLQVRSGLMPARAIFDAEIPPVANPSWILDIDSFTSQTTNSDVASLVTTAEGLAKSAYAYFKWMITDKFVEEFGGRA